MIHQPQTLKVLTGNRLRDGTAVWYGPDASWIETLQGALAIQPDDEPGLADLTRAEREATNANFAVDFNVIDVRREEGRLQPVRLRELIRAEGPTIIVNAGNWTSPGHISKNGKADHVPL